MTTKEALKALQKPPSDNLFDPITFGARVAAKLEADGSSIRKAAPCVPCSPATLHRVSQGKMPDVENYLRISRWLTEADTPDPIYASALLDRIAELEAAKWNVKHVDTMNDMVAMGMARDAAKARASALANAVKNILPIGDARKPDNTVFPIYVRMGELRALHDLVAASQSPSQGEES